MAVLIALLTLLMVVDCVILILLVLIQLPKKDAGAGLAFGGSATDALFGAGSGTVLTKITKFAAAGFFIMAMVLSGLQINYHRSSSTEFQQRLNESAAPMSSLPPMAPSTSTASPTNAVAVTNSNSLTLQTQATNATKTPALPNSAPASPK